MPSKKTSTTVNKSAKDGRFVTNAKIKSSPTTTYKQTVEKASSKGK